MTEEQQRESLLVQMEELCGVPEAVQLFFFDSSIPELQAMIVQLHAGRARIAAAGSPMYARWDDSRLDPVATSPQTP